MRRAEPPRSVERRARDLGGRKEGAGHHPRHFQTDPFVRTDQRAGWRLRSSAGRAGPAFRSIPSGVGWGVGCVCVIEVRSMHSLRKQNGAVETFARSRFFPRIAFSQERKKRSHSRSWKKKRVHTENPRVRSATGLSVGFGGRS